MKEASYATQYKQQQTTLAQLGDNTTLPRHFHTQSHNEEHETQSHFHISTAADEQTN